MSENMLLIHSRSTWNIFTCVLIFGHLVSLIAADPLPLPLPEVDHNSGGESHTERVRVRRQYYVCPPEFERVSSNCYYFSQHMATWQDAHYDCRDRHSELAILQTPSEDKKLRGQLNKSPKPQEWWIGGIYDWEQMKWKWGASGKKLSYHGFSRMGPENKEKLKWHCIILDPSMKYKWSSRSCVLGKHYICQKKVVRVNKRGLEKLRKKYNNTLNEIPAPIYDKPIKPRKHENQANGHAQTGLKSHRPNGINVHHDHNKLNNAFGHRRNSTEVRKGRKRERKNRDKQERQERRKNRRNKNRNLELHIRNGTNFSALEPEKSLSGEYRDRRNRKRNRRNKSKESNSVENSPFSQEDLSKKKNHIWNRENGSMEDITQKTTYMTNTLSPLHPRVIIEEHDFLDLNNNHQN